MAWTFNPFTDALDKTGAGGASYIDGEVEFHSDLPVTVGSPAVDSAYLVRKGSGVYFLSRKPAGIWVRETNDGDLDDWVYAGTWSDLYRDANFRVLNSTDVSKELAFDCSAITTATTRTLTVPDASGTLALTGHTHQLTDITNATVASTGVLTGGVLSTGAGASQFSISDGTGLVVNAAGVITPVSWTGKTNITPTDIATQLLTFVAINSNGNVVESATPFSASAARSNIVLGAVIHVDNVNVDTVNNEQVVAYQPLSSTADVANAIGFANISGNVFSANGANLNINKSAGVIFKFGANYNNASDNPHYRTLAALTAAEFQYRFSNGASGVLTETNIDPDNLDDGAGGLTPLGNNQWSVQRLYSFISNRVKAQRGVTSYATKAAAIAGIPSEPYVTEPSIAANGLLRGWLVVKKGATALNGADAEFLAAPKFGESTASAVTNPPGDAAAILLPALKGTPGTISVGQVVRTTGYSSGKILVELADADAAGEMPAIGVVRESMTDSAEGVVIFSGVLEGVNTGGYSVGDPLYVSTTAGALTNTRPATLGAGIQAVARVLSVDATAGVLQVVGAGRSNDIPNFTAADKFWYGAANGVATEAAITTAGRDLLDDADASAQRTTLGLGTAATSAATDFVAESTATTKGDLLARSASAITRIGVGADGTVLTADSAEATGVKWAAASGGVSAVDSTLADVMSVSGSNLVADDGGLVDSSNPVLTWDDAAGKAVWDNPLKRTAAGAFYVGVAPTTTALGLNAVNLQSGRTAATKVASGDHSVAIGYTNQSSGALSVAIGYNTQSTNNGAVAIGWGAVASNLYAVNLGGYNNQATQRNAVVVGGVTALADRNGARAFCSHSNSALGHRQELQFFLSRTTTNNTASEMWTDEGNSTRITIPSGKVMGGIVCVTGSKSDGSAVALYTRQFVIKNVGGTTTLLSSSTIGTDYEDNASTDITVEANDTNDALRVNVTGITGETWRWTGWVHCTEHYYGT